MIICIQTDKNWFVHWHTPTATEQGRYSNHAEQGCLYPKCQEDVYLKLIEMAYGHGPINDGGREISDLLIKMFGEQ